MILRRAIRRHDGIAAECPVEGDCQGAQITQGKIMTFSCPHYHGTQDEKEGLYVRCSYSGPECKR